MNCPQCHTELKQISQTFYFRNYLCETCYHSYNYPILYKTDIQEKLLSYGYRNPLRNSETEKNKMERKEMPKLDVSKYIGAKVQVVSATIEKLKFGLVLKLVSEPIPFKEGDSLPDDKQLTASILLKFAIDKTSKKPYIGIDSKLDKFMIGHKIDIKNLPDDFKEGDRLKAFEGIYCVAQKSDTGYLELA